MRNQSSTLRTSILLVFSALLLAVHAFAHDAGLSIGLNFGANEINGAGNATLSSSATAGAFPQANWNNLSGNAGTSTAIVADQNGASTPSAVSVTWTSPNTWSSTGRGEENNGFPSGSGDHTLMIGYIDSGDTDATAARVTVSGIDPIFTSAGYDVVVYGLGGVSVGRYGAYSINGVTNILNAPANPSAFVLDPGLDNVDAGTHVIFKNLTASSFELVANAVTAGGNGFRAPITAIQIIRKGVLSSFVNVGANPVGSATQGGDGSLTIVGGGNDIWATHDEFAYAYDTKAGDFDVRVRVESITPNARWSKAGIMVRETLAEDSRMVFLRVTPPDVPTGNGGNGANDIKLGYRTGAPNVAGESGGEHEDPGDQNPPPFPNAWLRLTRSGNVFAAHISGDGSTWTTITSQDTAAGDWTAGGGPFKKDVTVGLAVSRHSAGPTATAIFHDVAFTEPATFAMSYASSRGNPNAILVSFTQTPDASTLVPASFDVVGITISSVTAGPFANSYWLNVDPSTPLVEGTPYTVTAFSVTTGGGLIGPVPDTDTFTHGAGYEAVGIHVGHNEEPGGINGHRNRTSFARGLYSTTEGQAALESNGVFEDPLPDTTANETFNTTIFGVLNVTTAGDYQFACSSDDFGELFLSTDDNPANKRLIAREPVWNGSRQYAVVDRRTAQADLPQNGALCNQTPAINLAAGQYYLEYVFNEGGGGNNGSVTWRPPGGSAFANGQTPIEAANFAPTRYHNGPERGALFRTLGPVTIIRQPASQTVIGGTAVTFNVGVDGTPAYQYQWRRNGQAIPGATGPTYTIPVALAADDGARFSVSVANEFSSANSAQAVLTVNIPAPPVLVSATPVPNLVVQVKFDKRLQASSAQNPANYEISGGVTVNSATLDASGTGVVLGTSAQADGTTYTLTVRDVREITGNNAVSPNPSTINFTTPIWAAGYVQRDFYFNYTAGLPGLVANPPTPSITCYTNLWEMNPADVYDNYGGRIRGYFVPTESGPHTFYIATDDPGQLYLSTDANPANKVLLAVEPVWSGRRTWTGAAGSGAQRTETPSPSGGPQSNISGPIDLVAGQRYYMESWFTEGGGGDNMAVAVKSPSGAEPAVGDSPITAVNFGTYVPPVTLAITQQPASQTKSENTFATFTVAATASVSQCAAGPFYQWYRNGSPIDGATGPSYTLGPVTVANDDGAVFKVVISGVGAQTVETADAILTVLPPQPLRVVRAEGACNLTQVRVVFDQFIDPTTGGDEFNYAVAGFGVADATVNADNLSVTLTLDSAQTPGQNYCVTISGVTSASGLTVDPNPTTVCFPSCVVSTGFAIQEIYRDIAGVNITDLLASPNYPGSPTTTRYVGALSANNGDEFDNYGTRISGWLIPPVSGDYVFYLASDDGGDFWLSTDNSPANLVQIAAEPIWAARRNYIGEADGGGRAGVTTYGGPQANISGNIPLVAGQMYYFEARMKEGGGGDNLDVAWKIPGGAEPVDGGAPISGAFLASLANPAGASVNITQQPADACAEEGNIATFTVGVNATPAGSILYQWSRQRPGGDWQIIGGAVGATYAPTVSLADNGSKYRVAIYVPGASATSAEVTLTTYHVNTRPQFTGGADQTAACGGSATVTGWATGIQPHSIVRTPIALATDFASDAGVTLAGVATVADGALKLTGLVGSQYGAGSASFPLRNFENLNVAWKSLIGGSADGADGYSLNIGDDLPADPGYGGEDGIGNGLRLTVDTFDNGGPEDGISIVWRGNVVAYQQITKNDPGTGVYLRKNTFVDASASVDASGQATFTYDGQTISAALPGYTGVSASRVLFWARTGGAFDNHWIDDVNFTGFPYDASSVENGQAVAFEVTGNDNPGLFASGPAISPSGTLTYTLAACAQGSANITVVLKDDAGTATCAGPRGSDTSAAYTFKISVTPDTAPPSITCPANIEVNASAAGTAVVTYAATASDNCCLASVVCTPASGSAFPVGATTVNCVATDGAGLTATCAFTVTVRPGSQPPTAVISSEQLIDLSPEFENPVLISCNWWNACLVADGWTSSDPEGGDLTYLWFLEGEATPIGAGPVITNCLEVGSHTLVLVVTDPTGLSDTASQTIEVVTAPLAIDLLIEEINEAHKHGVTLSRKIKRELTETLRVALNHAGRERLRETQKALDAFEKKVRAQVAKTEPEAAAAWIRWSQAVSEGMEKCIKPPRKSKDHDDKK